MSFEKPVPAPSAELVEYTLQLGIQARVIWRDQNVDGPMALVRKSVSLAEEERAAAAPALAELLKLTRLRDALLRSEEIRRIAEWSVTSAHLKKIDAAVAATLEQVDDQSIHFLELFYEVARLEVLVVTDEQACQEPESALRGVKEKIIDYFNHGAITGGEKNILLVSLHRAALKIKPPLVAFAEETRLRISTETTSTIAKLDASQAGVIPEGGIEELKQKIVDKIINNPVSAPFLSALFSHFCRILTLRKPEQKEERDADFTLLERILQRFDTFALIEAALETVLDYYVKNNENLKVKKLLERSPSVASARFFFEKIKNYHCFDFNKFRDFFLVFFRILQISLPPDRVEYEGAISNLTKHAPEHGGYVETLVRFWNNGENKELTKRLFTSFLEAGMAEEEIRLSLMRIGNAAIGFVVYEALFKHLYRTGQQAAADRWQETVQDPVLKGRVMTLRGQLELALGDRAKAKKFSNSSDLLLVRNRIDQARDLDPVRYKKSYALIDSISLSHQLGEKHVHTMLDDVPGLVGAPRVTTGYIEVMFHFMDISLQIRADAASHLKHVLPDVVRALYQVSQQQGSGFEKKFEYYLLRLVRYALRINYLSMAKELLSKLTGENRLNFFIILLNNSDAHELKENVAFDLLRYIFNQISNDDPIPPKIYKELVSAFEKRGWLNAFMTAAWGYRFIGIGTIRGEIIKYLLRRGDLKTAAYALKLAAGEWKISNEDQEQDFQNFIESVVAAEMTVIERADPRLTLEQKTAPERFLKTVADGKW